MTRESPTLEKCSLEWKSHVKERSKSKRSKGAESDRGRTFKCNVVRKVVKEISHYCRDHSVSLAELRRGLVPDAEGLGLDGRNVDVVMDTDDEGEEEEEMEWSCCEDSEDDEGDEEEDEDEEEEEEEGKTDEDEDDEANGSRRTPL